MKIGVMRHVRVAWLGGAMLALSACGGGGGGGGGQAPTPQPTITLSAAQTLVQEGQATELTWSSTNAAGCTASGGWSGALAASGTQSTGPLTATSTYNLACTGPGGTNQTSVVVTVQPIPSSVEIEATPRILRGAQTSQLAWAATRVSSCEATGAWSGARPASGSETVGPFVQPVQHTYALQCAANSGGFVSDTVVVAYRAGVNMAPTANAGPDLTAFSTQTVELNGAASSSDDHALAAAEWRQTGGPSVTLQPAQAPLNATFVAPTVTSDTVLTFDLFVTDDEGLTGGPDSVSVTVRPIPPIVTLTGDVQFESVPHGAPGQGLSYSGLGYVTTRAALVEVVNASSGAVIASGTFTGDFQFDVPSQTEMMLRATAQLTRQPPATAPHWQISVRDLDAAGGPIGAVYSYTGPAFNSGAGGRRTLQIPSGWSRTGALLGARHAAPFAVLHAISSALDDLEALDPRPSLPALTIDWGPNNAGGQTFYTNDGVGRHRIVLSGEVNVDTDEYDPSVVLHELGHFIMAAVSRNDSMGGPHGLGDRLDMRLAYSEGFATAFGALVSRQATYLDSFGAGQGDSSFFSVDFDNTLSEGWYNEFSVHELLWSIGSSDLQGVWDTLHAPMQQTDALTSVFPFFTALKQLRPAAAPDINARLAGEQINGGAIDPFGSTETNSAGSANVLPIYGSIGVGGTVVVRSTNEFGLGNKLSTHRYLRLSLAATTNLRFQATATAGRDPDIEILRRGASLGPPQDPDDEDFTLTLDAGEYVLDVYDCGNAGCNNNVVPAPTDITVTITQI